MVPRQTTWALHFGYVIPCVLRREHRDGGCGSQLLCLQHDAGGRSSRGQSVVDLSGSPANAVVCRPVCSVAAIWRNARTERTGALAVLCWSLLAHRSELSSQFVFAKQERL